MGLQTEPLMQHLSYLMHKQHVTDGSARLNLWLGCLAVVSGQDLVVAFSQAGKFHTMVYRGLEFDKNNWSCECCIATEFEMYVVIAAI